MISWPGLFIGALPEQTALAAVSSDPSVITLLTFTVAIPDGLLITRIHREK